MDDQKKEIDTRFQNIEMTLKQVQETQTTIDTIVSNLIHLRLPSPPFQNPKENVRDMTLRSGKELKEPMKNREI